MTHRTTREMFSILGMILFGWVAGAMTAPRRPVPPTSSIVWLPLPLTGGSLQSVEFNGEGGDPMTVNTPGWGYKIIPGQAGVRFVCEGPGNPWSADPHARGSWL